MSLTPTVSSRRRIGAVAAACSLVVSGLLTGASAVPEAKGAAAVTSATCGANAHERVRPNTTTRDPNDVSASEVATQDSQLAGKQRRMSSLARVKIVRPTSKIVVNVYTHVITRTTKAPGQSYLYGYVPPSRIANQIAVLNTAYAASGFSFVLKGSDSRANNTWYNWSDVTDDGPAKRALHKGTTSDLNLYFAALDDDLLGYSTFPWENTTSAARQLDGVVILNNALPGGTATGYNLGDTAVHEIGHWLGLFHTFEGACSYVNDAVADTPAQSDGDNIFGCNTRDDTCSLPGTDPVRNYMSYGDDGCLTNFTSGQGLRMRQSWYSYRVPTA